MTGYHATNKKLVTADPSKGVRVDAAIVAKGFRDEIKAQVAELKAQGIGMYNFFKNIICGERLMCSS